MKRITLKNIDLIYLISFILLNIYSVSAFSQVYKFRSSETDIESNDGFRTKHEISYHTIDLNKRQLIFKGIKQGGVKTEIRYHIDSYYVKGNYLIYVINEKGVKEFWISNSSPVHNLGYDLSDGRRLVHYKITQIK